MFDLRRAKGPITSPWRYVRRGSEGPRPDDGKAGGRDGPLPRPADLRRAGGSARAGIVHRDLKPGNIMVDRDGNARIMDFGIARSLKAKVTGAEMIIGTPEYMSPEQVEGRETDQRSDIYSLGIILYEMVAGRVPFEGDTPFTMGVKHKSEVPRPPKEVNAQIPEDLNRVILERLEKDKGKRYQSAGELRAELGMDRRRDADGVGRDPQEEGLHFETDHGDRRSEKARRSRRSPWPPSRSSPSFSGGSSRKRRRRRPPLINPRSPSCISRTTRAMPALDHSEGHAGEPPRHGPHPVEAPPGPERR